MKIADIYAGRTPAISFEFFPPKTAQAEDVLFEQTVPALKRLDPAFFSVTYGAGGSTRDATVRITSRIKREFDTEAMAHLTCVGSTREMLGSVLDQAAAAGIENVLCLRGDPPKGQTEFRPVEGGFAYADQLVRFVRQRGRFGIGVAGYPEGHVECKDRVTDWDRCAAKVEAGGQFVITQLFYDFEDFVAFHDHLRHRRGVSVPIVPGVLPFQSAEQIKRFTSLCGSKLPDDVRAKIERHAGDDEAVRKIGVEVCTELARKLLDFGVAGLHFYCLNRATSVSEIVGGLALERSAKG